MKKINLKEYLPKRFIQKNNIIKDGTIDSINNFISKYPSSMIFLSNTNKIDEYKIKRIKNTIYVRNKRAVLRQQKLEKEAYYKELVTENNKLREQISNLNKRAS